MIRRNIIHSIRIFCKALDGETHSECAVVNVPGKVKCELVAVVLPIIPQVERQPGEFPETHACFGCEAGVRCTVICGDTIEWGSNKTAFEGLLDIAGNGFPLLIGPPAFIIWRKEIVTVPLV